MNFNYFFINEFNHICDKINKVKDANILFVTKQIKRKM